MGTASTTLRRLEIALWIAGVCLLGGVVAANVSRWQHQRQQERALVERGSAVSVRLAPAARSATRAVAAREVPGPHLPPGLVPSGETTVRPEPEKVSIARVKAERDVTAADAPLAFGRIEIPRVGIRAIVDEGADDRTLARAVGLIPGSAKPGENGNVVLAGHRDTFFRPLRKIELSDRIRLVVPPHTYEYEVQSVRVVSPEETSVLASKGVDELTLVTCYPFRFLGPAPERFIVSATRVN